MPKQEMLFIINPISGLGKQKTVEKVIREVIDDSLYNYRFAYTEYKGHAEELALQASKEVDYVIAVGGDGTVNEVSRGLINTDAIMGILPAGSGNGLARHLNIPLKVKRSAALLNSPNVVAIDTIKINNTSFVNVGGIGFDAFISHEFDKSGRRGPLNYVQLVIQEYPTYRSKTYHLEIDGKSYKWKAFLLSFANSSQYGNNAFISPNASTKDGLIDVCVIKHFPMYQAPAIAFSLFDKSLHKNKYDEVIKARQIKVINRGDIQVHIDGEPHTIHGNIYIDIKPASLRIITGKENLLKEI